MAYTEAMTGVPSRPVHPGYGDGRCASAAPGLYAHGSDPCKTLIQDDGIKSPRAAISELNRIIEETREVQDLICGVAASSAPLSLNVTQRGCSGISAGACLGAQGIVEAARLPEPTAPGHSLGISPHLDPRTPDDFLRPLFALRSSQGFGVEPHAAAVAAANTAPSHANMWSPDPLNFQVTAWPARSGNEDLSSSNWLPPIPPCAVGVAVASMDLATEKGFAGHQATMLPEAESSPLSDPSTAVAKSAVCNEQVQCTPNFGSNSPVGKSPAPSNFHAFGTTAAVVDDCRQMSGRISTLESDVRDVLDYMRTHNAISGDSFSRPANLSERLERLEKAHATVAGALEDHGSHHAQLAQTIEKAIGSAVETQNEHTNQRIKEVTTMVAESSDNLEKVSAQVESLQRAFSDGSVSLKFGAEFEGHFRQLEQQLAKHQVCIEALERQQEDTRRCVERQTEMNDALVDTRGRLQDLNCLVQKLTSGHVSLHGALEDSAGRHQAMDNMIQEQASKHADLHRVVLGICASHEDMSTRHEAIETSEQNRIDDHTKILNRLQEFQSTVQEFDSSEDSCRKLVDEATKATRVRQEEIAELLQKQGDKQDELRIVVENLLSNQQETPGHVDKYQTSVSELSDLMGAIDVKVDKRLTELTDLQTSFAMQATTVSELRKSCTSESGRPLLALVQDLLESDRQQRVDSENTQSAIDDLKRRVLALESGLESEHRPWSKDFSELQDRMGQDVEKLCGQFSLLQQTVATTGSKQDLQDLVVAVAKLESRNRQDVQQLSEGISATQAAQRESNANHIKTETNLAAVVEAYQRTSTEALERVAGAEKALGISASRQPSASETLVGRIEVLEKASTERSSSELQVHLSRVAKERDQACTDVARLRRADVERGEVEKKLREESVTQHQSLNEERFRSRTFEMALEQAQAELEAVQARQCLPDHVDARFVSSLGASSERLSATVQATGPASKTHPNQLSTTRLPETAEGVWRPSEPAATTFCDMTGDD